jgi:hypothetical protein
MSDGTRERSRDAGIRRLFYPLIPAVFVGEP